MTSYFKVLKKERSKDLSATRKNDFRFRYSMRFADLVASRQVTVLCWNGDLQSDNAKRWASTRSSFSFCARYLLPCAKRQLSIAFNFCLPVSQVALLSWRVVDGTSTYSRTQTVAEVHSVKSENSSDGG